MSAFVENVCQCNGSRKRPAVTRCSTTQRPPDGMTTRQHDRPVAEPWRRLRGFLKSRIFEIRGTERVRSVNECLLDKRASQLGRGRAAASPVQITASGWRDILWRVVAQIGEDRLMMVAAGVTYYLLLAVVPALSALVSVYGLAADPQTARTLTDGLVGIAPAGGLEILNGQLERLTARANSTLGLTFLVSLAFALWTTNAGVKALFDALNVVYGETEKRSFLRLTAITMTFTLCFIVGAALFLGLIVGLPTVLAYVGLGAATEWLIRIASYGVSFLIALAAIVLLYRYGPSRRRARWRWITPGAAMAVVLILGASTLFSWYAANFSSYNATYGSLGAIVGFMTWIWIAVALLLLGAEIDAEMEHQTAIDTTRPPVLPMGERGAYVADHLGKAHGRSRIATGRETDETARRRRPGSEPSLSATTLAFGLGWAVAAVLIRRR